MSQLPEQEFKVELIRAAKAIRAFAISLARDRDRADDLMQASLLKALENYSKFEAGTNMEAWLSTIVRNTFYDQQRSHANSRTDLMGDDDTSYESSDSGAAPFAATQLEEINDYIDQKLDERDRSVFLMWVEGLKTEEIAKVLELSRSNVGVILHRIRKLLYEKFGDS